MDATAEKDMRERMVFEGAREALPPGYPKLPELPIGRYTDPDFYKQEIEGVWKKTWLTACHVSELPEPGSYLVLDLPFAPVVVTRAKDGHIHALLNACRHRGAPVVRDVCGKAKKLVCQYHSWTYDLDGRLVHTPQPRDFDPSIREGHDLGTIRCEVQNGFVFVNFDDDAPSLEEFAAPLTSRYSDLGSPDMQLVAQSTYDVPCNWKLLPEAFIETYHIDTIHPNTAATLFRNDQAVMVLHPYGHSVSLIPYREDLLSGAEGGDTNWASTLPRLPGVSSFFTEISAGVFVFPNIIAALDPAGYPLLSFWPTAINRTRFDVKWYGVPWEGEMHPEWAMRQAGFEILTDQDLENLGPIQKSLDSAAHDGVPLSYQERRIYHLHRTIDEMIDTSKVPQNLLVPDLLAEYVEP